MTDEQLDPVFAQRRTKGASECRVHARALGGDALALRLAQLFNAERAVFVSDIDGKVRHARSQGRDVWYCIMDGQDTARVLRAYGEL